MMPFLDRKTPAHFALTLRLGIPQDTKSVAGRQAAYFERRRAELAQAQGGGAVLPSSAPATGVSPAIAPPSAVPQISLDVIGLQYLLNRAAAKSNVAIAQLALPAPHQLLALPAPGDETRPEAAEQQAAYMQRGFPPASTQPIRVADQAVHRTNGIGRPQPMAAMMMSAFDDDPSAPCGMIGTAHEPLMPLPRLRVAVPNEPPAAVVAPPTAAERVPVLVATLDESNFSTPPDSHWPPDPVADADKALDASVVALIDDSGTGMDIDVIHAAAAFIPHADIAAFDTAAHARRHAVRKGFAADLLSLGFTDDDDDVAIGGDCSPCVAPLHVHMHNPHGGGGAAVQAAAAACDGKEEKDDIDGLPVVTVAEANATVAALSELLNGEEVARPPPAVLPQLHALVPLAAPQDAFVVGDIVMDCKAADTVAAVAAEEPALPSGEPPPDVTLPPLPERPTRGKRMVALALQHAGVQAPAQIQDGGAAEVGMLESYALQMHATLAMVHSAA
jgi:hypothetical protein